MSELADPLDQESLLDVENSGLDSSLGASLSGLGSSLLEVSKLLVQVLGGSLCPSLCS